MLYIDEASVSISKTSERVGGSMADEEESKLEVGKDSNDHLEQPAIRPPRRISRPKITLQMPSNTSPMAQFYTTPQGMVTAIPITPATGLNPNFQYNMFFNAYPLKAQEFMFKQFAGVKDFTKNTGKLGLSFGEKFAFWCYGKAKGLSTNSFTHIFLLIVVCLYCVIGGILFYFCESEERENMVERYRKKDNDAFQQVTYNIYTKFTNFTKSVHEGVVAEVSKLKDHYHQQYFLNNKKDRWGLLNSMYFCGTIFTTIGYGHLAPVTVAGRIMTIIYSIIGIPLFLILLADYGKLLTRGIKYFWSFVRQLYFTGSLRRVRKTVPVQEMVKGVQMVFDMTTQRKSSTTNNQHVETPETAYVCTPAEEKYEIDDNFNLPVTVAFIVLSLYMIGGAYLFSSLEGWTVFESFYFVFISTSTIGLGDFVPKGQVYVLLCSLVYFIFGLALTSMFINVVTEKLTDEFRKATMKIGATMGLQGPENILQVSMSNEHTEPNSRYEEPPLDS